MPEANDENDQNDQNDQREETDAERLNRNFGDLLQELRVAQTGVQILFAFLLTLAFTARFDATDGFGRTVYLVAMLSAAAASSMLIAPVAYHRMLFRQGRTPALVRSAHRMASGGLAFLLVAIVGAVLLVTDLVLPRAYAIAVSVLMAIWFALLWGVLPWLRRNAATEDGAKSSATVR